MQMMLSVCSRQMSNLIASLYAANIDKSSILHQLVPAGYVIYIQRAGDSAGG